MNQFRYTGEGWEYCNEAGCHNGDNHYSLTIVFSYVKGEAYTLRF